MFKKLINLIAFCSLFNTIGAQTCDVDLIGYDPVTHQVSVVILDGENCGCNEYTQQDGNTCDASTSSITNNNDYVSHLVFGIHYQGLYENTTCTQTTFHPGWAFGYVIGNNDVGYTGDTLNFTLNTTFNYECVASTQYEDYCWEFVIWQINLSQTVNIEDFPNDFWTDTCGTCANQTQMYPDVDLSNNSLVWCPGELPPPPLYPGCMDPNANNYDETAGYDDGTCEYPAILGCTNPTACNYNQFATENDGSCATCDTPGAEEICNAYHNSDDYWEWYSSLFDCDEELTVDIKLDSLYVHEISCNIFNTPQGACTPGIRYHTFASNVGQDSIYSYTFTWNGPNGYFNEVEFGVNFNGGDNAYAVPLPPGVTGNVNNSLTTQMIWEEGDELCVTATVIGDQEDIDLSNNTVCITLPAYPICVWGCTDPCAENYNENATCDNGNCEYPDPIIDTIYIETIDTLFITLTDTIYIETIDTIYIELPPIIDTVFVELPPDTITEYIQITDTLEIEVIEYVFLTDTITEIQFIDCNTGLPCEEDPGGPGVDDCWPWAVYIPNVMTPNNDNVNDVWKVILDLGCWVDIEFRIFNRWGTQVYHGFGDDFNSYPYWDGSVNGGDYYVSDGVYTYTFYAKKWNSVEVFQKAGHITVLR